MHVHHVDFHLAGEIDERGHQQGQRDREHAGHDGAVSDAQKRREKPADQQTGREKRAQHGERDGTAQ